MPLKTPVSRIRVFLYIAAALVLSGCPLPLSSSGGPLPYQYNKDALILAWDAEQTGIEGTLSATSHFDVYYRPYGKPVWIFIKSTPDFRNSISIMHDEVGDGDFEFAVQAVYNSERTSDMHGSSDFSAWPAGGWYIRWRTP